MTAIRVWTFDAKVEPLKAFPDVGSEGLPHFQGGEFFASFFSKQLLDGLPGFFAQGKVLRVDLAKFFLRGLLWQGLLTYRRWHIIIFFVSSNRF